VDDEGPVIATGVSASLEDILVEAEQADPSDRINHRDAIAAHGDAAIEAMTDWLGDERLAAFAIRVLERIGRDTGNRQAVVDVLAAVDRAELPTHLAGDVDRALSGLGLPKAPARAQVRLSDGARPVGTPGVAGRGYWVMRTSPWERPYIWAEARRGRLRQGWGVDDEQNLEVIAEALRRGAPLSGLQKEARRALKMLATVQGGIHLADLLVAPNLPEYGRLSVFKVSGSYVWSLDAPRRWDERFGHVLPVELLVADVDRRSPKVSDALRAMLRPQTRLYNISASGGDVERLIGNEMPQTRASDRWGQLWTEREYEALFGRFPPTADSPTDAEIQSLAAELRRSFDAISWQWADGKAYCAGASASTTSEPLKAWLDRTGACGR
jgi:hypothetical protein